MNCKLPIVPWTALGTKGKGNSTPSGGVRGADKPEHIRVETANDRIKGGYRSLVAFGLELDFFGPG